VDRVEQFVGRRHNDACLRGVAAEEHPTAGVPDQEGRDGTVPQALRNFALQLLGTARDPPEGAREDRGDHVLFQADGRPHRVGEGIVLGDALAQDHRSSGNQDEAYDGSEEESDQRSVGAARAPATTVDVERPRSEAGGDRRTSFSVVV
jgi:hypothetical protein